jgi:GTP cyclohydrolase I
MLKVKESLIRDLLQAYNLEGENFDDTPRRYIKTFEDLLNRPKPKLTTFPLNGVASMLFIKDYITWSLCPHHLLPVRYTCKIGYIPEQKVLGLSKLCRIADYVMSALPLQEEIPGMIHAVLKFAISPKGCGVIITGEHLCMRMRGVQSENTTAVSSGMYGVFFTEAKAREEFLTL